MDIFGAVDRAFEAELASGRLDRALHNWGRACVGSVSTIEELVERCRGPEFGTPQQKDEIVVALCLRACQSRDQCAAILLCWLFLPGLSQVVQAFHTSSTMEDDDLVADLLAGFWEAASHVTQESRCVARFLLLGARRLALKSMRRASRADLTVEHTAANVDDGKLVDVEVNDRIDRAVGEGIVSHSDVELVFTTRATIGEVAARYQLSLSAAQQARHRARARLAVWLNQS